MKNTGINLKISEELDVEKNYDNNKASEENEQKRISNENLEETTSHDIEV